MRKRTKLTGIFTATDKRTGIVYTIHKLDVIQSDSDSEGKREAILKTYFESQGNVVNRVSSEKYLLASANGVTELEVDDPSTSVT